MKFDCPNCGQSIAAEPEHAGMHCDCPTCNQPIVVPCDNTPTPQTESNHLHGAERGVASKLPTCRTCGDGSLVRLEKYRLSTPVVIIGYILLMPSITGVLTFGGVALISMFADSSVTVVFGTSVCLFFAICSFLGGLLGWLLVMKKEVLQCNHCGATVAAS